MSKVSPPGFDLVRLLGRGGMGEVYLARRQSDGRSVALKISRSDLGEQGVARLRRESALLARVASRYLPEYLELFDHRGHLVLAMEFVEGTPLDVEVEGLPPPAQRLETVRRILPDLAAALATIHDAGIVHRDLKPANCILAEDRCVLVDLGLAWGPDVKTLTGTGLAVGTPTYLPPEQISGERVEAGADVYQLALTARDLLVGGRVNPGQNPVNELVQRSIRKPTLLSVEHPWIPASLAAWIQAALHPDPAGRPDTVAHLEAVAEICRAPGQAAPPNDDPSWFGGAVDAVSKLPQARAQAREKNWDPAATEELSIWSDLEAWEQRELSVMREVPTRGEPDPARSAALRNLPAATDQIVGPGPARIGLISLIAMALGWGVASFLAAPRGEAPPLIFSVHAGRLTLQASQGVESFLLDGRAAKRNDQGFLSQRIERPPAEGHRLQVRSSGDGRTWVFPGGVLMAPARVTPVWDGFEVSLATGTEVPMTGEVVLPQGLLAATGGTALNFRVPVSAFGRDGLVVRLRIGPGLVVLRTVPFPEPLLRSVRDSLPREFTEEEWQRFCDTSRGEIRSDEVPFTDPTVVQMKANASGLALAMSWSQLRETRRALAYRRISPVAIYEWLGTSSRWSNEGWANVALGDHHKISLARTLLGPVAGNERLISAQVFGGIQVGIDDKVRARFEGRPYQVGFAGHVDDKQIFRAVVGKFPDVDPLACEISVRVQGSSDWSTVSLLLGEKRLVVPLQERFTWRSIRVPPAWFRSALNSQGTLHIGVTTEEFLGLPEPKGGTVALLRADAIYHRVEPLSPIPGR